MLGIYCSCCEGSWLCSAWYVPSDSPHLTGNHILILDTFGFKHLLWVYSGRRGIHCWISDPAALDLNDEQRRALVTFMEVIKGSKEQMKKVNVRGPKGDGDLHPYLEYVPSSIDIDEISWLHSSALTTLKTDFVTLCLRDQDCFKTERQWETLLSLLPGDRGMSSLILSTASKDEDWW